MDNNKVMKVVQINTLGATLSTGRTTREMHNYFIGHGIDSHIVCPAPIDCDDVYFFSSHKSMKIDTALTILTGLEAHHSCGQTKNLIRYLDSIKPDIVHLRILHSNYINLHLLLDYLAKNDAATVITLHDFWFLTGKCCFYTNLKCDKWLTGCYDCKMPKSKKRPVLFERSKKMWLDKKRDLSSIPKLAFIGVSDWVIEEAKKSPICKGKIVKRIYNWIDLDSFYPHDSTILRTRYNLNNKFVILGVSAVWKCSDRKGLDVYLRLAEKMPNNYSVVLVGQMDYDETLPKNVISIGPIKNKSVLSDFYSMADVYLNLSTEETFGKVSAESLACGTPVVAIDATANKELVSVECGIVIKTMEISEILSALNEVYVNRKEYYSNNCRNFVNNNFNMQKNITEYIDLYKQLMCINLKR